MNGKKMVWKKKFMFCSFYVTTNKWFSIQQQITILDYVLFFRNKPPQNVKSFQLTQINWSFSLFHSSYFKDGLFRLFNRIYEKWIFHKLLMECFIPSLWVWSKRHKYFNTIYKRMIKEKWNIKKIPTIPWIHYSLKNLITKSGLKKVFFFLKNR